MLENSDSLAKGLLEPKRDYWLWPKEGTYRPMASVWIRFYSKVADSERAAMEPRPSLSPIKGVYILSTEDIF